MRAVLAAYRERAEREEAQVFLLVDAVDAGYVRVKERSQRLPLTLEAGQALRTDRVRC